MEHVFIFIKTCSFFVREFGPVFRHSDVSNAVQNPLINLFRSSLTRQAAQKKLKIGIQDKKTFDLELTTFESKFWL